MKFYWFNTLQRPLCYINGTILVAIDAGSLKKTYKNYPTIDQLKFYFVAWWI